MNIQLKGKNIAFVCLLEFNQWDCAHIGRLSLMAVVITTSNLNSIATFQFIASKIIINEK